MLKFSFLFLHFFEILWHFSILYFTQDFDLEIYFTQELSCTYFVSILHMKPFPLTVHCLFSFAAFLLLNDPKTDMWNPEVTLLTSSLILPYVPGMRCLIFICFGHMCIQMTSLIFVFVFMCLCPYQKKTLSN